MNRLQLLLGKHSDVVLVLAVLGVLVVLFVPIPKPLLDFLVLANFSFAFLILLLTFFMTRPVEFSTFPSLLLVATLFRLSLNVAATRLILSEGDAGRVIGAIGSYVVAGNYVVGLIVFLILIVVQYVVVTNGAQRVSEVAARFTLDSMPGQQMSIDADLNMGFIDQAEAQRRRKNLEKEAGFYAKIVIPSDSTTKSSSVTTSSWPASACSKRWTGSTLRAACSSVPSLPAACMAPS
ncbi:MAG: flhA [Ramlibacter sp.]|nr:flhA [Ramlibacter sp.]